ncbi:cI repressor protein [Pseudomonas frederiksbergensis]|uniref:CI repressor protein n=1 Tax=Pseudomonas frederiksbergensis TaxID=104087 RepID=A0A1J0EPU0_9PSED|nr:S24 family peptidase [Pseudomonas frederiksbergensis]APC18154.1 cI repressor protein [Pseudomonas frederiksbergensis]
MKKPIRTPLSADQLADAKRLSDIYKVKAREAKERPGDPPLTQTEVGERCGWNSPQSTVSQYMTGKVALNLDALVKLAKAIGFEPSDVSPALAAGVRMRGGDNSASEPPSSATPPPLGDPQSTNWDDYAFIDQYDAKAAAGSGYDNTHVVLRNTLAFKRDWLRMKGAAPKNLKVIYAHGDSMWPTISDRDVLLVDESRVDPSDGQIFVMFSQTKGTIVKRLIQSDVDGWIIRSDNPDKINFGDQVLPNGEIHEHRILGRVIWRGGDL